MRPVCMASIRWSDRRGRGAPKAVCQKHVIVCEHERDGVLFPVDRDARSRIVRELSRRHADRPQPAVIRQIELQLQAPALAGLLAAEDDRIDVEIGRGRFGDGIARHFDTLLDFPPRARGIGLLGVRTGCGEAGEHQRCAHRAAPYYLAGFRKISAMPPATLTPVLPSTLTGWRVT